MSFTSLLKQRASIDRPGTGGPDDYTERYTNVPCYKRDAGGSAQGDSVTPGKAQADTLISMQTGTDVKVGDRVRIDGMRYDVLAVDDVAAGHHKTARAKHVTRR